MREDRGISNRIWSSSTILLSKIISNNTRVLYKHYFVINREKQGKVNDGELRTKQEKSLQQQAMHEMKHKTALLQSYKDARKVLEVAVMNKQVFSDYLESVVNLHHDKHQHADVVHLMDRCQGLLASR